MQLWVLSLLLAGIFSFFLSAVQIRIRSLLIGRPALIWAVPFLLTAVFAGAAALAHALNSGLVLIVLAYTIVPVLCVSMAGPGAAKRPTNWDFLAILAIWLPLEFGAGAPFVPVAARGFLHSVAYGVAILLGLLLFLGFRSFPGLKYTGPQRWADAWLPLAGFVLAAPVLIVLGIGIGFIPPPHLPAKSGGAMAAAAGVIFAGTAVPEEILFRSLIQNLLMLRFGAGTRVLLAASFIFGCAHLDNGPQPLPNWRYMILATIAGVAYGRVFQKASTVLSSAALHAMVDWTKHFFF
jgi:hypothetical protein